MRLNRGMTAQTLASRSGISKQAIYNLENGAEPLVSTAYKLARALRTSSEELFKDYYEPRLQ